MSFLEDVRRVRPDAMMSEPLRSWSVKANRFARSFLRWWIGELAGLVPAVIRDRFVGRGNILSLRLTGGTLLLGPNDSVPLDIEALPASWRRLMALADTVELVLPASLVLRRSLDIPAAAAAELAAAVPFLIERHTPFLPDQARSAWRIRSRATAQGQVRVELAVTAAAALDRVLARLHHLDVVVSRIHVDGDDRLPRLDFTGARHAGRSRSWLAEPWRPLLAAAVALLLAGPPIVAAVVHARAAAVMRAVADQGAKPQEVERLWAILRADMAVAKPLAARTAEIGPSARLKGVTEALPDSSWIFSFDLTPQTLQLGGFSADMPTVVARLEALPGVEHLEFRAPVLHDARAERDRFDILLRFAKAAHAERVPSQPNGSGAASADGDLVSVGARRGANAGERGGRSP